MAILYGTTPTGETLPVQVNESGQLVAQGLEGPPGPQGEQGIQGEPGPAGEVGSVIRSIQHVETTLDRDELLQLVSIAPVNEAKAFVSYGGSVFPSTTSTAMTAWQGVGLTLVGGSRVQITRYVGSWNIYVWFSVIEYL